MHRSVHLHPESTAITYAIGDIGPGGGTIFYYSESAFSEVGSACENNCHYLEWAPSTWSGSSDPAISSWATDTENAVGTSGSGFENTAAMLTSAGSYQGDTSGAAHAVHLFAGTDSSAGSWFLPSVAELAWMSSSSVRSAGNFRGGNYWSSTENLGGVWLADILGAASYGNIPKSWPETYVRPIRAF